MIPGKILSAEIRGGTYTSKESIKRLELYMDDHKLTSPAIPFESLVTDRSKEADTARWVTKLYYPIY